MRQRTTVNVRAAGLGSVFPASSTARTRKVWFPRSSACRVLGDLHGLKGAPSSEHSKVERFSLELNLKVGVRSRVLPPGPAVMVVSGACESSTYVRTFEQAEVLPA